jgi:hypothetical protein
VLRDEIGTDETLLFWHVAGTPTLFACASSLMGV